MTIDASIRSNATATPSRRPPNASASSSLLAAGLRRAGVYVVIGLLSLFCVVPFAWVLLASVDRNASLYAKAPVLSADNFIRFFQDAGATLLALLLSVFGGYALSRFHFAGRKTLMFGILLVRVVPATATIVPLYLMMIQLHLNNSYIGIILVEAAYQLPLVLWLMKGFFDAIPLELEEASWTDGCSRIAGAVRIVIPLSRPGLGAGALFTFINVWGDFLTPLVLLTSPEKYPISIGLFQAFSGHNQVDWGLLTATAVLYMIPTVVLYLFARRYLLQATFTGALKG
jgi:multiple sugar transport system permease protein